MQFCSSLPSPHPSLPEHTIAVLRHRPFPHFNGQYRFPRAAEKLSVFCSVFIMTTSEPQRCGGSSLPSLQLILALQNSYSGRHSPDLHGNVFAGHFLDFLKSQCSSSSPLGHCILPSHINAFETHLPLRSQVNAFSGHFKVEFASCSVENEHSSSEPS